jgi:hypothetical protein
MDGAVKLESISELVFLALELSKHAEFVSSGTADYSPSACLALCRAYITASNIDAPPELDDRDLFAFGYFFDRGLQAGLVHDESGGTILVQHFWDAAQIGACQNV